MEYVVHESLEDSGAIFQSERQYSVLVEPIPRPESCFPFVSFLDAYVVESPS